MKPTLRIFVANNCPGCNEAHRIAATIKQNYPDLPVELIDIIARPSIVPEAVFATPTFMLDNRIVSLGNPGPEQIKQWALEAAAFETGCKT